MNMLENHRDMKLRIGGWSKELTDTQKTALVNDLVLYLTQIEDVEFEPDHLSPSWRVSGEPIVAGQAVHQDDPDEIDWNPPAGLDKGLISVHFSGETTPWESIIQPGDRVYYDCVGDNMEESRRTVSPCKQYLVDKFGRICVYLREYRQDGTHLSISLNMNRIVRDGVLVWRRYEPAKIS